MVRRGRVCMVGLAVALALPAVGAHLPRRAQPTATAAERRPGGEAGAIDLRGRVLGPDGEPVAGAHVYLIRGSTSLRLEYGDADWPAPRPRAVTGPDGRFHFSLAGADLDLASVEILAVPPAGGPDGARGPAEGKPAHRPPLGVAWDYLEVFDASGTVRRRLQEAFPGLTERLAQRREPVLHLVRDDVPLEGRIKRPDGQPVAGATVSVANLWRMRNEDLTGWLRAVEREGADFDRSRGQYQESYLGSDMGREEVGRILAATTDREGRFRLTGVGRERIAYLRISGPGIQTQKVHARTRPGPALPVRHVYHTGSPEVFTFYGARFEHTGTASAPVAGVVRDVKSGQPLEGVLIRGNEARTVTDAQGRYRLEGLGAGGNVMLWAVAHRTPHLPAARTVQLPADAHAVHLDWELLRGAWIRGRVTDVRTGKAVWSRVDYYAPLGNPAGTAASGWALDPIGAYWTDADGRYAVPGLPGRGIVAATSLLGSYDYLLGVGAGQIEGPVNRYGRYGFTFPTRPTVLIAQMVNALAQVNVPDKAGDVTQDLALDPGQPVHGRVLDGEGRPLAGVHCCGDSLYAPYYLPLPRSGEFSVKQYTPDRPRTVLFYHPEQKLAGSLILRGVQPRPLEVRLKPGGVLTGRIVRPDGKPWPHLVLVSPILSYEEDPEVMTALPERYYHTDRAGRFRIEGLASGVKYAAQAQVGPDFGDRREVFRDVKVRPGEIKDLGDRTVQPLSAAGGKPEK